MEAFENYKKQTGSNTKLVLVGKQLYKTNEMHQYKEKMEWGRDVLFLGRLGEQELNNVLSSALALTFVPYFEGFGIPLLEAMQCGTPIISSNVTSMPEVVGDAGLLVDPYDVSSITNAMVMIEKSPKVRSELVRRGLARKSEFSWEKTSNLLWRSIERIL